MTDSIDRRGFLKATGAVSVGIGLAGLRTPSVLAANVAKAAPNAETLGWRLGCESWSFHLFPTFSFFDAIDKTASLGLHYLESGGRWPITKKRPNEPFGEDASTTVLSDAAKRLGDSGVKLIGYWPNAFSKDPGQSRKLFDFAKRMGVETLVGEPEQDALDTLDRLCEEYHVSVAIHNHPKPSPYWSPDIVLKACQGHSKRIGACADTGHWMRSGLHPVECIKKLEGRVVYFHFKDLNQMGAGAHDVPWGTGAGDVKGMLTEVRRQGTTPIFIVEYEYKWENNLPEIAQSVAYFDKVAAGLAANRDRLPL